MPVRLPPAEQQRRKKLLLADLRASVAALTAGTPSSSTPLTAAHITSTLDHHSPSCSSSTTPSPERAKQLAQVGAALQALLASQQACVAATPPPPQQQRQKPLGEPCTQPGSAAAAAGVGCFGGAPQGRLAWNAFQRACKGRGMSKPQISAAYAAAKVATLTTQAEVVSWLDAWLQQAEQQQHQHQHQRQAGANTTTTWGAVKQWARSRAASRAASRTTSPDASPAPAAAAGSSSHSSAGHELAAGPWGALKRWAHSRSSNRTTSRRATPATSPNQAMVQPGRQQAAAAAACVDADVPFASQLDLGSSTPTAGVQQQQQQPAAGCNGVGIGWIGRRMARETVRDDHPLLRGFGRWHAVDPDNLKQLKAAVPALPGVYEWGLRPASSGDGDTRVLAVYVGKAGTLRRRHLARRTTAPHGYRGETLRTRLNKYCLSSARRVGPVREPNKDALFAAHLAAGDRLCFRWWAVADVAGGPEPSDIEQQLLHSIDYAFNYLLNTDRRRLLLPSEGKC